MKDNFGYLFSHKRKFWQYQVEDFGELNLGKATGDERLDWTFVQA
jgi:hypothetical protein